MDDSSTDTIFKEIQHVFRKGPILVLGSGASIASGEFVGVDFPGMAELAKCLREQVPGTITGCPSAVSEWGQCEELLDEHGLEGALEEASVSDSTLLGAITTIIGEVAGKVDREFHRLAVSQEMGRMPLLRLMAYLVASTTPGDPVVHVVTPNYDHVVEYACDLAEIPCVTRFVGYRAKCFDTTGERDGMTYVRTVTTKSKRKQEARTVRHVRLHKPHGSLSWYETPRGPMELFDPPEGLQRIMVAPGNQKYEQCLTSGVLDQHRGWANKAIRKARAAVFYGYGFNDRHLETAVHERLEQGMPAIVLAREFTKNTQQVVGQYGTVWGFESHNSGATVCVHDGESQRLEGRLWDLEVFLTSVLEV